MSSSGLLKVVGSDPLAEAIRGAAATIRLATPVTIVTSGRSVPDGAIATGPAMLSSEASDILPEYLALNVLEDVRQTVAAGSLGHLYGCFASHRIERESTDELVRELGLLPLISCVLAILPGPVHRVWATSARLLDPDEPDAWFVTLTLADGVLVTLETMAINDLGIGDELLIEITGSDGVLRVEPMRQAVWIDAWDEPPVRRLWWENPAERFVEMIAAGKHIANGAERLHKVWDAILESDSSGLPVALDTS